MADPTKKWPEETKPRPLKKDRYSQIGLDDVERQDRESQEKMRCPDRGVGPLDLPGQDVRRGEEDDDRQPHGKMRWEQDQAALGAHQDQAQPDKEPDEAQDHEERSVLPMPPDRGDGRRRLLESRPADAETEPALRNEKDEHRQVERAVKKRNVIFH